ncbi:DUF1237-domain-containing protein [Thermothelomyces heterothallicus CBS 203.75]
MAFPFLTGSRRVRFITLALLFITLVLWFTYQTPLSTVVPHDPFDLHKDPQYPDAAPDVARPPHDPQDHATPEHDHPAQEVEKPKDAASPPLTSTGGDAGEGSEKAESEPRPGESTTSTAAEQTKAPEETENAKETGKAKETGQAKEADEAKKTGTATTATAAATAEPSVACVDFETLQRQKPGPLSEGRRKFPYVRPPPECRKFRLPALEALIERMRKVIRDPDLFRLFENSYPNTLDTMVKWRGYATRKDEETGGTVETDEELTYVITGDIDAMWLRDSASQVYSYLPLLEPSDDRDSLASLWRGLINAHARYIIISPYCHSFQPPAESGIKPTNNAAYHQNHPFPAYDPELVFDCKWELDSLASFLQISTAYYRRTGDLTFFAKYSWVDAVEAAVDASAAMRRGTYDEDGRVLPSAWTFTGWTNRGSETLTNDGLGNPVRENGMVRSAFRPSDDACIFQLLTPSNMMWAAYLEQASEIMQGLADGGLHAKAANLTTEMRKLAGGIRRGIALDAVVHHRDFGDIFAYEVDGYGGVNLMDDANVPSLLAMPLWNYTRPAAAPGSRMVRSAKHAARSEEGDDKDGDAAAGGGGKKTEAEEDWRDVPPPSAPATDGHAEAKTKTPAGAKEKEKADADADGQSAAAAAADEEEEEEEKKHDYAKVYQNTRRFVLSTANPYFAKGPALSAVGGPHLGPGKGWPMAAIVAGLTAFEDLAGFETAQERDAAVAEQLFAVLNSTAGTGVVHETVNAWDERQWTRAWFGWANGLFGELILRIAVDEEKRGVLGSEEGLLGRLWQD